MASTQPLHFVLPESHASVSGGNVYNAALLACLEQQHGARRLSIAGFGHDSLESGIYLIDSLNLAEFQSQKLAREPSRHCVLLVHHLPSLEPGLAEDDPALALECATLGLFDGFICTSTFARDYLHSLGHRQPSICIEPVIASPRVVARPIGKPVQALLSCNLIRRKGVLAFLEALAKATVPSDPYGIDIVGRLDMEASYSAACRACIDNSESLLARVRLRGAAPYADMPTWYRKSNLFVSASRMETYGIALQEARHFGLPIVAVQGGNSGNHLVPGVTGSVYADPSALAEGFLALVRQPELFSSYQKNAHARRPTSGGSWSESAELLVQSMHHWFPCY